MSKIQKKILIVVESIDIEDSSGSKANVALIQNLYKAGFEILVYHYTRKEIQIDDIQCISIRENRRSFLFFLSRIERQIRYKTGWKFNKYIEQLFGFSFTLFNDRNSIVTGLKKLENFEPDLVLTLSKGGSFRPHHALLKIPEYHARWMAYIHDPYPFAYFPRPYDYVEPGHQQKRNFMSAVGMKAKFVAYPSELLAEWMESYYQSMEGKKIIIPHQILDKIEDEIEELPDFFDPEKFNILHAGTLLWGRSPMGLVKGFLKFLEWYPEAKRIAMLFFIGGKNYYTEELEKISSNYPEIFISKDYLPFAITQALQAQSSVNVILEAKGPISPFLPGKFPHCIQAGKPILLLGPYYSESKRLLGDHYKYHAEIDEVEKISKLIAVLYENWKLDPNSKIMWDDLSKYLSSANFTSTLKTNL
ncbi:UDP-glycosyltransferase [Salegentibacter sp. LM13S]|uniref:UDP-glycosyltransferase n=1 Tax=Salegentibacter lacus TaxID=2873599 RepID=UPI001CCCF0F6|nr:UDP-glycosyltransferase [Salegentibacter lacus]MBZ9632361.1 UDP-glycosyltransferase [Salegentibacter lacus]